MVCPVANLNVTAATENENCYFVLYQMYSLPAPPPPPPPSLSLSRTHTEREREREQVLHAIIFKEYKLQLHSAVIFALYKGLSNSTSLGFLLKGGINV